MRIPTKLLPLFCVTAWLTFHTCSPASGQAIEPPPTLRKQGTATQLMVDGESYLICGYRWTDDAYDDADDLAAVTNTIEFFKTWHVNTNLVPLRWRDFEPEKGHFDYRWIDSLITAAEQTDTRLVVVWFGESFIGNVVHAPDYFKQDQETYARAIKLDGTPGAGVSPHCQACWSEDGRVLAELMRHIRETDTTRRVIAVQVENESGVRNKANRDFSPAALKAWQNPVPDDLMQLLVSRDGKLHPWLQGVWEQHGKQTEGSWPEVFGDEKAGETIFSAYYWADHLQHVMEIAKKQYDFPFFLNDWIGSIDQPGGMLAGGPEIHFIDIYRLKAPAAFALGVDIYKDNRVVEWMEVFTAQGNPLIVPEIRSRGRNSVMCLSAFMKYDAVAFCALAGSRMIVGEKRRDRESPGFQIIQEITPVITAHQGKTPKTMTAFAQEANHDPKTVYQETFHGYTLKASPTQPFPPDAWGDPKKYREFAVPGGIGIVAEGDGVFMAVGTRMKLEFHAPGVQVDWAESGRYHAENWKREGDLNLSDQGDFVSHRFPDEDRQFQFIRFRLTQPATTSRPK